MSTPADNNTKNGSAQPSDAGANAWKINRTGLAAPSVSEPRKEILVNDEEVDGVKDRSHSRVASGRGRGWLFINLAAGVILFVVLGLLWAEKRSAVSAADESDRIMRSEGAVNSAAAAGEAGEMPRYRALVIGINRYSQVNGEGWPQLRTARADAEAVAETLISRFGFEVRTLLDEQATRSAVLSALDEMATTGDDGADLIYFAGHGSFDEKLQEGYWIPVDARKSIAGHAAKDGWLWNSTLTRLISASNARHVLVLSDACYSGSLFRGDKPLSAARSRGWYERAISIPSRYLITSGGLEPVLDSGTEHSVFAQQVLNYLNYSEPDVFSANDLGSALREQVASLTGQMVQMGPLPLSAHAGGEFVFVRHAQGRPLAELKPSAGFSVGTREAADRGADASFSRDEALRNALALTRAGASRSAVSLINVVLQQNAQDQLARAVADYIRRSEQKEGRDELRQLIEKIDARGKTAPATGRNISVVPPPRVLACLGPEISSGTPTAEHIALLYRIMLRSGLENRVALRVIEREALETLLQEQNLGASTLADPRARLAIGKLLPASLLLLGDVIPSDSGELIYLRLVDTETTQVLASFSAARTDTVDQEKVCDDLTARISDRIVALKPLTAVVTELADTHLRAALGNYHAVKKGAVFTVLSRRQRDKKLPGDFEECVLGSATVNTLSEFSCDLDVVWGEEAPATGNDLWIRELSE